MLTANNYTDLHLLEQLRNDDEQAFTIIYKRYWERLYVIAYRKLGIAEEAEEIVQDIFLDIWKRRKTIALDGDFDIYLAVAVKYKVINNLAARNRKLRLQSTAASSKQDCTTLEWLDFTILERQLAENIERLPEKCRLVFVLSRSAGLNHKQIASKLGITEKTVESHITKAIRSLRSALQSFFSFF